MRERERERERLDTLIPGVPLNLYSRCFLVTIKHSLPHNRQTQVGTHIHREENIEIQRQTSRREAGRERERESEKNTERDSKYECRNTED